MNITIIGTGYVGLVTGACLALSADVAGSVQFIAVGSQP